MQGGEVQMKLYSGRENPHWTVTEELIKQLQERWATASRVESLPHLPALGYQGIHLHSPTEEWIIYREYLVRVTDSRTEIRNAGNNTMEKLLIASSPKEWELAKIDIDGMS